jgi:hypothetical protein
MTPRLGVFERGEFPKGMPSFPGLDPIDFEMNHGLV